MLTTILLQNNSIDLSFLIGPALVLVFLLIVGISRRISERGEQEIRSKMTPEELEELERTEKAAAIDEEKGAISPSMVCPHCQTKGTVRTKRVKQKTGISGGKATAAILTGGVSLVATGLAKKAEVTQASCENCNCQWVF